ncbi:4634_t:CDS:2, partial [Gigaspora rosea]
MIKIPEDERTKGIDFYKELYRSEEIDHKAMEEIVGIPWRNTRNSDSSVGKGGQLEYTMDKMKFEPRAIKLAMKLFKQQEVHIIGDNELSTFEPLLRQLENKIVGISLGRQRFKLAAYANDLSIG